jgi:hypothetical protein
MGRGLALWLVGLFALAGGCASPARYVEKQVDSGIVAVPSNTNAWPSYNMREAYALIEKHVGPHYEIVEQREVVTGQSTSNNTQVNTDPVANGRNPALVGEKQTATSTTTQKDLTEWRIWYRRVARPEPFINDVNNGGVAPAGGPAPGTVPSVMPVGHQNVGNPPQRWISGAGSHTMPTGLRPTANDPNCNH